VNLARADFTAGAVMPSDPNEKSFLTTARCVRLPDTDHSLKAGERGPTLLEDFHLREKITHFDHERILERVVYASGATAHGVFTSYGTALRAVSLDRVWDRAELVMSCSVPSARS
jgi:catalase